VYVSGNAYETQTAAGVSPVAVPATQWAYTSAQSIIDLSNVDLVNVSIDVAVPATKSIAVFATEDPTLVGATLTTPFVANDPTTWPPGCQYLGTLVGGSNLTASLTLVQVEANLVFERLDAVVGGATNVYVVGDTHTVTGIVVAGSIPVVAGDAIIRDTAVPVGTGVAGSAYANQFCANGAPVTFGETRQACTVEGSSISESTTVGGISVSSAAGCSRLAVTSIQDTALTTFTATAIGGAAQIAAGTTLNLNATTQANLTAGTSLVEQANVGNCTRTSIAGSVQDVSNTFCSRTAGNAITDIATTGNCARTASAGLIVDTGATGVSCTATTGNVAITASAGNVVLTAGVPSATLSSVGLSLSAIAAGAGNAGRVRFANLANTQYITVKSPDAVAAGFTLTLPGTLPAVVAFMTVGTDGSMSYDQPRAGSWGADSTALFAAGEWVPPYASLTKILASPAAGITQTSARTVTTMYVAFVGNVLNAAGQTVTFHLYKNGVDTGGSAGPYATNGSSTGGNTIALVVGVAAGDQLSILATTSAGLTAALTMVSVAVK
jgi:hypothetical protein